MNPASSSDRALQSKVVRSLDGLSDDNLNYLLEFIERFMKPASLAKPASSVDRIRKLGVFKHGELYAADYDIINEDNDIVSGMLGVLTG